MIRYNSKVGLEMIVLLSLVFGASIVIAIVQMELMAILILGGLMGIILTLFKQTYYLIDANNLIIKSWFIINIKIDIDKIRKIAETNNPISSPALSLDRLGIYYNKSSLILISPKDKQRFIEHILSINPNVEVMYKKKGK